MPKEETDWELNPHNILQQLKEIKELLKGYIEDSNKTKVEIAILKTKLASMAIITSGIVSLGFSIIGKVILHG